MTPPHHELSYRRYRAPQEDRGMLVLPPLAEAGRLADENRRRRAEWQYDVQGRPLAELISQARAELLHIARKWTAAYRPEAAGMGGAGVSPVLGQDTGETPVPPAERPIFLAGHQPELFHPGVWMKNFALGTLAARHAAVGVNLVIDSDLVKNTSLRVPGGSVAAPSVEMIPLDRAEPRVPYEERRVADRPTFAEFGRRVADRLAPLVPNPLATSYWPLAVSRLEQTDNLGACLAQSRHLLEGRWGLSTLEVPQSWICETESFAWFVVHLLAGLPRLARRTTGRCGSIAACIGFAARAARPPIWKPTAHGWRSRFGCGPPRGPSAGGSSPGATAARWSSPIERSWRSALPCRPQAMGAVRSSN